MSIRRAAVAGMFYPSDPIELRLTVEGLLAQVAPVPARPKALIVPHAGYSYSGPVAASAYAQLNLCRDEVTRVILLGPTHHVRFQGLAACTATAYETPLGRIAIDNAGTQRALQSPAVQILDAAHLREHSLEVQLPFLQVVLRQFQLVPLVVGEAAPEETAAVLAALWGGSETLLVISSDLSHYHDSATAQRLDAETCRIIESRRGDLLTGERACGCRAIHGLLSLADQQQLPVTTLDLRNSGEFSGSRDRVVGYGAWLVG